MLATHVLQLLGHLLAFFKLHDVRRAANASEAGQCFMKRLDFSLELLVFLFDLLSTGGSLLLAAFRLCAFVHLRITARACRAEQRLRAVETYFRCCLHFMSYLIYVS